MKKICKLFFCVSGSTFGDVSRDTYYRLFYLACQIIFLFRRQKTNQLVYLDNEVHG